MFEIDSELEMPLDEINRRLMPLGIRVRTVVDESGRVCTMAYEDTESMVSYLMRESEWMSDLVAVTQHRAGSSCMDIKALKAYQHRGRWGRGMVP